MRFTGIHDSQMRTDLEKFHGEIVAQMRANLPPSAKLERVLNAVTKNVSVDLSLRLKTSAGMAVLRGMRVVLHYRLMRNSPDHLRTVYAHELAHLVAFYAYSDAGHGDAWKRTMEATGEVAARCHQLDVSPFRKSPRVVELAALVKRLIQAKHAA